MTIPSTGINEASPAGSDNKADGDNRIREHKTQVRQIMEVDHEYPSSGQSATAGQHKQVTLQEQADLGTGAVGATILGSQTISGKGELVYTDEDDNDVQLTDNGSINFALSAAAVNALVYPVGSIYANASVSTNPATLLGVGTWVAIEEETLVGYKSGSAEFGTLGSYAGGEKTHTLTTAEIPAHTHTVNATNGGGGSSYSQIATGGLDGTHTTSSVGSDTAHNNIQPSYVVYLWRRTS